MGFQHRAALMGFLVAVSACGGGTTSPPPPPPPPPAPGPPATISMQAGDAQSATAGQAVAVRPSVKVVDASNRVVPNVSVTFTVASGGGAVTDPAPTTDASGIATVGSWTMGLATGSNTLTASVAAGGVSGNPVTITAAALPNIYQPGTNANLSGTQNFTSVTIPAGVTVTMTGDLVLNVTGPVTIAGSLVGDCKKLTLTALGALTVTGTVRNVCTDPAATAVPLVLIGEDSYSFQGATIASSGDLAIVNDPGRVATGTPPAGAALRRAGPRAAATTFRCRYVDTEVGNLNMTQPHAHPGQPNGDNGLPGASRILECGFPVTGQTGGSMLFNNVTVYGQDGADGGSGEGVPGLPSTRGGNGGAAGGIVVTADDDIVFDGPVSLREGNGGRGGDASITGVVGNPGQSVAATSGNGGGVKPQTLTFPVLIQAGGTIAVNADLHVILGHGGNGGDATALAGDGVDGNPGKNGGNATVGGGNGGNSAPQRINASGAVTGLGLISIGGGDAGNGGTMLPVAGLGGNAVGLGAAAGVAGNETILPNSGNGGAGQANGQLRLLRSSDGGVSAIGLNSRGGKGGDAVFRGGNGGNGSANCPTGTGGAGGAGGNILGGDGIPGAGSPMGAAGTTTITNAGNGGRGGDGLVRGAGGAAGANGASHGSGGTGSIPGTNSFQTGTQGNICAGAPRIVVSPVFENNLEVFTTQANLAEVPVTVSVNRVNFTGPVTLTQSAPDAGITSTYTGPIVLPDGTNSAVVTLTIQNAAIGDHVLTFTANATVNGNPVIGQGSFTVHVPGGDRYAVTITKNATAGNDRDGLEPGVGIPDIHELAVLKEMIGTTPKITVYGLLIGKRPRAFVRSGNDAFDGAGNFFATTLPLVPVPGHGDQPSGISITGVILASSISFTININPVTSATFQFGHVDYTGAGPKKP
jgi:hypothetical protein